MATYLITGSSRGLGLTFATFLSARPESEVKLVIATARSESKALADLKAKHPGRVEFVPLEVNDAESAKKAAGKVEELLGGKGLDVLINNAGILPVTPDGVANMKELLPAIEVNVQGPHNVISAFLPLLKKGNRKVVANISTAMGSIAMASQYPWAPTPAYKISKAALNMLIVQYAIEYEKEGFAFIMISPGWLQTDMGSAEADLPVETGAKGVLKVIDRAKASDSGKFFDIEVEGWDAKGGPNEYKGEELPW